MGTEEYKAVFDIITREEAERYLLMMNFGIQIKPRPIIITDSIS